MASPRAIVDVIEDVTFEEVQDGDKSVLKVHGVAKRADIINKNRRFYHESVLRKAVDSVQDEVKAGGLIGLMDHPQQSLFGGGPGPKGSTQKTAIKWTDVRMEGKDVIVDGVVVKTAAGRDLQALIDAKVKIGLSTNMRGSSRYVKASELDSNYEPKDAYIQVFDVLDFNTIDVVNAPADTFAGLSAVDSLEEELKDMTKEELKEKFPELYKAIADDAASSSAASAKDDESDQLVAEVTRLRKENKDLKDQQKRAERTQLVTELLADAKLPKLGTVGKIDLDARFRKRLEDASVNAEDENAARAAVQDLIDEQKALTGAGGDPAGVSDDDASENTPGLKRRKDVKDEKKGSEVVSSIRGDLGLF